MAVVAHRYDNQEVRRFVENLAEGALDLFPLVSQVVIAGADVLERRYREHWYPGQVEVERRFPDSDEPMLVVRVDLVRHPPRPVVWSHRTDFEDPTQINRLNSSIGYRQFDRPFGHASRRP